MVAFLLLASFGMLLAGCGKQEAPDEFVITDSDMERFRELADKADERIDQTQGTGSTSTAVTFDAGETGTGTLSGQDRLAQVNIPTLDLSRVGLYDSLRTAASTSDAYVVNLEFANMRSAPSTKNGTLVARLDRGAAVRVIDFVDAEWARVKAVSDGKEGFMVSRALAKSVTEDRLEAEKAPFANTYFVDFAFVNVREAPDQKSAKIGEIPGQSLIRPLARDDQWTKVSFQGKEGYVSSAYLSPFLPTFLVRQDKFTLPILMYDLSQQGTFEMLSGHIAALKQAGFSFKTLRSFHDLLVNGGANARLTGKNVIIGITGLTAANVKAASDSLLGSGVTGVLFIRTDQVGIRGITEKTLITLVANGLDVESAGHTGDDLRALTNAQVELEFKQSRKLLEDMSRRSVVAVAYPAGGVNDRVSEIAGDSGYLFGVSNSPERSFGRDQLLRLPSYPVFPGMAADEAVRTATGS
jgi:SH3-like domain-containing protein